MTIELKIILLDPNFTVLGTKFTLDKDLETPEVQATGEKDNSICFDLDDCAIDDQFELNQPERKGNVQPLRFSILRFDHEDLEKKQLTIQLKANQRPGPMLPKGEQLVFEDNENHVFPVLIDNDGNRCPILETEAQNGLFTLVLGTLSLGIPMELSLIDVYIERHSQVKQDNSGSGRIGLGTADTVDTTSKTTTTRASLDPEHYRYLLKGDQLSQALLYDKEHPTTLDAGLYQIHAVFDLNNADTIDIDDSGVFAAIDEKTYVEISGNLPKSGNGNSHLIGHREIADDKLLSYYNTKRDAEITFAQMELRQTKIGRIDYRMIAAEINQEWNSWYYTVGANDWKLHLLTSKQTDVKNEINNKLRDMINILTKSLPENLSQSGNSFGGDDLAGQNLFDGPGLCGDLIELIEAQKDCFEIILPKNADGGARAQSRISINLHYSTNYESGIIIDFGALSHAASQWSNKSQNMIDWSEGGKELLPSTTLSSKNARMPDVAKPSNTKFINALRAFYESASISDPLPMFSGELAPEHTEGNRAKEQFDLAKYLFWNSEPESNSEYVVWGLSIDELVGKILVSLVAHIWAAQSSTDLKPPKWKRFRDLRDGIREVNKHPDDDVMVLQQPVQFVFTHPASIPPERLKSFRKIAYIAANTYNEVLFKIFEKEEISSIMGLEPWLHPNMDNHLLSMVLVPEPMAAAVISIEKWYKSKTAENKVQLIALDFGKQTFDICVLNVTRQNNRPNERGWDWHARLCFGAPLGGQSIDFYLIRAFASILADRIVEKPGLHQYFGGTQSQKNLEAEILFAFPHTFKQLSDWKPVIENRFIPNKMAQGHSSGGNTDSYGRCVSILRKFEQAKQQAENSNILFKLIVNNDPNAPDIFPNGISERLLDHKILKRDDKGIIYFECEFNELIGTKVFVDYLLLIEKIVNLCCHEALGQNGDENIIFAVTGRAPKLACIEHTIKTGIKDASKSIASQFHLEKQSVSNGAAILARQPSLTTIRAKTLFYLIIMKSDNNGTLAPVSIKSIMFEDNSSKVSVKLPKECEGLSICPSGPNFDQLVKFFPEEKSGEIIQAVFQRFLHKPYVKGPIYPLAKEKQILLTKTEDNAITKIKCAINDKKYIWHFHREGFLI